MLVLFKLNAIIFITIFPAKWWDAEAPNNIMIIAFEKQF